MSFIKEELDPKGDEHKFANCSSSKNSFTEENYESQEEEEEDADSHLSLTYTGKNSKATLSDRLTYKLIKEYECRPCLWQKDYCGDKSFSQKQKAFEDIAQALNLSSDIVKEKLRTLRVIFYQNVKKAAGKKVGFRGNGFQPRWRFYEPMLFLVGDNLQKMDAEKANSNRETTTLSTQDDLEENLNDNSTFHFNSEAVHDPIVSMVGEDCSQDALSVENDHQPAYYSHPQATQLDNFGKYVSLTLAQIDDEIILKRAKSQIQLVLSAAITEYAKKNLSTISSVNGKKFRK